MSNPVEAARSLESLIRDNRDITESGRRLAPDVVRGLKAKRLCRLGLEPELGGTDEDPIETLKTFEFLASVEASVAWIVWNNHFAGTFGRFLDGDVREEVYGDVTHIYANSARPEGVAKVVDGGYSVSGKWTLVSGCEISDWFALRCIIQKGEDTPQLGPGTELRIMFVRREEAKIIDTWTVGGLRGTGSHDVEIHDSFVPAVRSISFSDKVKTNRDYSKLPIGCINSAGCASMALGLAQKGLDSLVELGLEGVSPGNNPDLRDRPPVQSAVANVTVQLRSARLYLHSTVQKLWDDTKANRPVSDSTLADVWAASHHAATTSRSALSEIFAATGTAALYVKSPIERAHRDIFAVLQHGIIQPHWMNQVGMVRMGIEAVGPMFRT